MSFPDTLLSPSLPSSNAGLLTIPLTPKEASLTKAFYPLFLTSAIPCPYMYEVFAETSLFTKAYLLFHKIFFHNHCILPSLSIFLPCIAFLLRSYYHSTNHLLVCFLSSLLEWKFYQNRDVFSFITALSSLPAT